MAGSDMRRDRLAAALRENLKKRKARARAAALAADVSSDTKPSADRAAKASRPFRPNAASNSD